MAMTKTERVIAALEHRETDRIPVTESHLWPEFERRWRKEKNLGPDVDFYEYYDLDAKVFGACCEPKANVIEMIENTPNYMIFRDGWGMLQKKHHHSPMCEFLDFAVKDEDDLEKIFEDPLADTRYYDRVWDVASIQMVDSFYERLNKNKDKFCIFGYVHDPYESIWRLRGIEQSLIDMVENPDFVRKMAEKVADHMIAVGLKQLEIAQGKMAGIWMWGDIAFNSGLLFSPQSYKELLFPSLKKMCQAFHEKGAKIVYHTDGDVRSIVPLFIEAGIDALQPLEPRAYMDVVELKSQYGDKLAYIGNIEHTEILAHGTKEEVRKEVLRKMHAARRGGYIMGSGHSLEESASIENYEYMLELIRKYGNYPLEIPEI